MKNDSSGKKKKDEGKLYAYCIELETPLDFARHALGYTIGRNMKAVKEGNSYKLLSMGERLGDIRLIYTTHIDRIGNFFLYNPGSDSKESFSVKDKVSSETDFKVYGAPIVEMLSSPYIEAKDMKKAGEIKRIEIKDPDALIKSVANYSHEEEPIPKLYAFYSGKDHIIGTFDFFHENMKIFTYAKIGIKERFSALTYSYTNDSIEKADSFTEKPVVYIRVINLKNPFPFF